MNLFISIGVLLHYLQNFLVQQIESPTHRDGNTLDLLFLNNADFLHHLSVLPSSQSDHHLIGFTVSHKSTNTKHDDQDQCNSDDNEDESFSSLNFFHDDVDWDTMNHEYKTLDKTSSEEIHL